MTVEPENPNSSIFDEDPTPLSAFDLGDERSRKRFLGRLSVLGEEGLMQATSHVWHSLASPKTLRCILMAKAVGNHGSKGKPALYAVLEAFLHDFERECDPPPLPQRRDFACLEDWHTAVSAHFAAGSKAMESVISRYSEILNGDGVLVKQEPDPASTVNWKSLCATSRNK